MHTCFTQNIDTLERRAGVPDDKIIEAHGSFASQRCIDCKQPYDDKKMKDHINRKAIAKCEKCGGYVKPDIVFFGEGVSRSRSQWFLVGDTDHPKFTQLPPNFGRAVPNLLDADLLIVMGTSLTVHPFASLAGMVESTCPRVLINLEHVGDFGARADDVILLGSCDEVVRKLCKELGWEDDLVQLWNETEASVLIAPHAEADIPETPVENSKKDEKRKESPAVLEAVEARLAKLSMNQEQGEAHIDPVVRPKESSSSETTKLQASSATARAEAVAREVASAVAQPSDSKGEPDAKESPSSPTNT